MFFKRLELVGFKSFAAKTTVDLQPGVTVIVGPNGCGKSNILDSIKWVLGTQSPKSLRGKNMQDVIFAGSASFKPLGVAQVTLTIDNSSRILDIDYDEVQISRRLYRTGESEYLLNKTPCRLRDLHNLFLGTGAGTSSYSILEQGKVDQIINAKPEERRFIFEEAAGISKYKVRKLEALRKLERTSGDLQRLEDLIGEIERQVNSLKRQANKAERYKELSAELRKSEMELLVLRAGGMRSKLKEFDEQVARLRDQLESLRARHARQSVEEQKSRGKSDELDHSLERRSREIVDVDHQVKDIEHANHRRNDRIESNKRRIEQIDTEVAEAASKRAEISSRMDEIRGRRTQAESERSESAGSLSEQEKTYAELRSTVDQNSRRIEELNRAVNQAREALSRCENTIRLEETLLARQEEARHETEIALGQLRTQLGEITARKTEQESALRSLTTEIDSAKGEASQLQIQFAETHSRIADLESQSEQVSRELHQAEARLSTLEELKNNFEGFHRGVREVMNASSRRELTGVIGPVAGLLKSRPDCELALEVALGSQLQDIVVADVPAARAAVDFLVRGEHGRVRFFPLDRCGEISAPSAKDSLLADSGVVGYAPDLVERESRYDALVRKLLGQTFIVRTFEDAERLSSAHPGIAFVDLKGAMFDSFGSLTGGSLTSSGLLGREREIAELRSSVSDARARLDVIRTQTSEQRAKAEQYQSELKTRTGSLHQLEVRRAELKKEDESLGRQSAETKAAVERHESQIAIIDAEAQSKREARSRLETERTESQQRLEQVETELDQIKAQARERNDAFITLGNELSEARGRIEKINERISHLNENLTAMDRELQAITAGDEGRSREKTSLEEDSRKACEEAEASQGALQELFGRRKALEGDLTTERAEKEKLAADLKSLHHEIEQIQRDERVIENDLHERQLHQAELHGNLNNLAEQAREMFDCAIDEIAAQLEEVQRDPKTLAAEVAEMRSRLDKMGPVNLAALDEYNEQSQRLEFLTDQRTDLTDSKAQIEESIAQLDQTTKQLFHETFESVRGHFIEMFRRLFNGGKADLVIDQTAADPLLEGGIEIYAQPPGKKLQSITLMSGGEKAMTAVSLLFALFLHKPAPFAILDEIDAPLDDANVERFKNVVMEFSSNTQFVIISHNKLTMELADAIYGVTMEESGVSKLVSVRFEHAVEEFGASAG